MRRLIQHDHSVGVFAPQYYGSVRYYATLATYRRVVIDASLRYNKRFKSVHRCQIVDTRGPLTLTLPVSRGVDGPVRRWSDMRVSSHGQWWADHRVSLESAYGRTPYFEYYIDRFAPWISYRDMTIVDYDLGLDAVIRRTLGIETEVTYSLDGIDPATAHDYRDNDFGHYDTVHYHQIRADRLGFVDDLSILDLLMNMGPESAFTLYALGAQRRP